MALEQFTNITDTELRAKGVVSLADRPNIASRYGEGGLSPTQLKERFDKLSDLLKDKINALQTALGANGSSYIAISDMGATIQSLADLTESFLNGDFANIARAYQSSADVGDTTLLATYQAIFNSIAQEIASVTDLISGCYTKSEVDGLISSNATVIDSAMSSTSENPVQNNVVKSYIDNLVGGVTSVSITVVNALPTTNIHANTIYLVPKDTSPEQTNVYNEYLYINGIWEHIGDTALTVTGSIVSGDTNAVSGNTVYTTLNNYIPKAGGTMAGPLTLNGSPTSNLHAASKAYVDSKRIISKDITASNWVPSVTYEDYGYQCVLSISGVTANDVADVAFGVVQATSGNYAPVCLTGSGTVTIYSKVNTAITVSAIVVERS